MSENEFIRFDQVTKTYDQRGPVLDKISFTIERGKFYTLLGPSGCGKTTILRLIAGFIEPTAGDIFLNGKRLNNVPANLRQIHTVFQDYALFPHLNVYENIAFGLRIQKMNKNIIEAKVIEALKFVNLSGYEKRELAEMSGGQKQRVAIARAIVNDPQVILLDEPLSALDLKLRKEMQYELRELQQRLNITFVFVTHDQEEALAMSDKIIVLEDGKIQQIGTPSNIYDLPVNQFVADFIGESNIIKGRVTDGFEVEFAGQCFTCMNKGMLPGESVDVMIRPEDLQLTAPGKGKIQIKVDSQLFRGGYYEIFCFDIEGNRWVVHSAKKANAGEKAGIEFEPEAIHLMYRENKRKGGQSSKVEH